MVRETDFNSARHELTTFTFSVGHRSFSSGFTLSRSHASPLSYGLASLARSILRVRLSEACLSLHAALPDLVEEASQFSSGNNRSTSLEPGEASRWDSGFNASEMEGSSGKLGSDGFCILVRYHLDCIINDGLIYYYLLLGLGVVGFCACTIPKFHYPVLLASTAVVGATAFVLGIDCFTTAGLKEVCTRSYESCVSRLIMASVLCLECRV
jgi:hypothetical protein